MMAAAMMASLSRVMLRPIQAQHRLGADRVAKPAL
jgi:hypothetical protein